MDYTRLAEFRASLRRFLRRSEEIAQGVGLTPQQHQALLAIKGFPGGESPTVGALAKRLQMRHNSAVGLMNRLGEHGYVERLRSKEDRRKVFLEVTAKGDAILAKLTAAHRVELRALGPKLTQLLAELDP